MIILGMDVQPKPGPRRVRERKPMTWSFPRSSSPATRPQLNWPAGRLHTSSLVGHALPRITSQTPQTLLKLYDELNISPKRVGYVCDLALISHQGIIMTTYNLITFLFQCVTIPAFLTCDHSSSKCDCHVLFSISHMIAHSKVTMWKSWQNSFNSVWINISSNFLRIKHLGSPSLMNLPKPSLLAADKLFPGAFNNEVCRYFTTQGVPRSLLCPVFHVISGWYSCDTSVIQWLWRVSILAWFYKCIGNDLPAAE